MLVQEYFVLLFGVPGILVKTFMDILDQVVQEQELFQAILDSKFVRV